MNAVLSPPSVAPNTPVPYVPLFQLTKDQQEGLERFTKFLMDQNESVFVIAGYSGCGKSTLVRTIIERLPQIMKAVWLVDPSRDPWPIELTATTNKAAESLSNITKQSVKTIHSFLGLRVKMDFRTRSQSLVARNDMEVIEDTVIFIDEASYVDSTLLGFIFSQTRNCKIVFIGDPAQLAPIKSNVTPVFNAGFPTVQLQEVVRQAEGNPIIDLSTKFRETVNTGKFFSFVPDGNHIQYMDRDIFNNAVVNEFTRPDWKYNDSKILAWTNKRVIEYNHFVRDHVQGDPMLQVGDYASCNKYFTAGQITIKTDQLVYVSEIEENCEELGIVGRKYILDEKVKAFMPYKLEEGRARYKLAKQTNDQRAMFQIEQHWIDLRAAYACTVNKAQGSTFDRVFIDLDDISRCNSGNQIARMLYVGVSRARFQVFLTGDLV